MLGTLMAVGGLTNLIGANKAASAQNRGIAQAAQMAQTGAKKASDVLNQYLGKATSQYEPYSQIGQSALSQLAGYINGTANIQQAMANDPNYQATVNEALKAVNNSAAASGALRSGATTAALYNQAQNLANQYYQNKLAGLQSLANYGQNAASGLASLYSNAGSNLANIQSGLYGTLGQNEIQKAGNSANKYSALSDLGSLGMKIGAIGSLLPNINSDNSGLLKFL